MRKFKGTHVRMWFLLGSRECRMSLEGEDMPCFPGS